MIIEKDNRFVERWARKLLTWEKLGGECVVCKNIDVRLANFHHKDDNKEIAVSRLKDFKWPVIWEEAQKCECYCCNCHFEFHTQNDSLLQTRKNDFLNCIKKISCQRCGYKGRNAGSLHFHHKKNKKFYISKVYRNKNYSLSDLIEEANKCELICANCHCLEHIDLIRFEKFFPLIKQRAKEIPDRVIRNKTNRKMVKKYQINNPSFNYRDIARNLNISTTTVAAILGEKKVPSKEEKFILDLVVQGMSHREVAKKMNCSRGRVRYLIRTRIML